jgi:periplasmic protein TonB
MTSVRLPVSFLLSACTTVALFWFLGMLIASKPPGELIHTHDVQIASRFIPEPQEPPRPPPVRPPMPKPHYSEPVKVVVDTPLVDPNENRSQLLPQNPTWGKGGLTSPQEQRASIEESSGSNRGPVPQVRIEPDYPPQARDRRIEGWVKFSYTVARDGSVKDVVILDAQPTRIWDSATIRAVSSWKCQPAVRDGRPVEQAGLVAVYRFELD